jgi:hypothetical protein
MTADMIWKSRRSQIRRGLKLTRVKRAEVLAERRVESMSMDSFTDQ